MKKIILASNSPSRAELLRRANIEFIQNGVDFNEDAIDTKVPKDFAYLASKGKLEVAKEKFGLDIPILTADSVVTTGSGTLLRKPKNLEDARRILELQSGAEIAIISAMHLYSKKSYIMDISATFYKFKEFDKERVEEYLEIREWEGKAGGCMVEGFCKRYISEVKGYESTARGLQIEKLLGWLEYV